MIKISYSVMSRNSNITVPKLFTCLVITVEPYSQLLNMVISLLRSLFLVPVKRPYIFLWENPVNAVTPVKWPTPTFWNPVEPVKSFIILYSESNKLCFLSIVHTVKPLLSGNLLNSHPHYTAINQSPDAGVLSYWLYLY